MVMFTELMMVEMYYGKIGQLLTSNDFELKHFKNEHENSKMFWTEPYTFGGDKIFNPKLEVTPVKHQKIEFKVVKRIFGIAISFEDEIS